jgi:hypothetical protein
MMMQYEPITRDWVKVVSENKVGIVWTIETDGFYWVKVYEGSMEDDIYYWYRATKFELELMARFKPVYNRHSKVD